MVEVSKLDKLSSRERRVYEAWMLADKPMTLEELAAEFGIAGVRVRQLEARALEKMLASATELGTGFIAVSWKCHGQS
jgi:DNA-directed RNA polymerase, sigma subunit (sigma70/sigma32)